MSNRPTTTVHIALGANLGDREGNIRIALDSLKLLPGIKVIRVSSMYENPAVGGPSDSPPFINAAAELLVTKSPRELLNDLLEVERELGRERRVRWEPRPIDLDLLLFGDQILSSADLIVPHPLLHERRFVLQPLAEIAPDALHPVLHLTSNGLLDNLGSPSTAPSGDSAFGDEA